MRTILIAGAIVLLIAGVATMYQTPSPSPAVSATHLTPVVTPVVVAILQDETGSTGWTRTPQLTPDDLEPVFQLIVSTGGEVALGLIRDSSNRGFARLRVGPPPIISPVPDPVGDAFADAGRMEAYRRQHQLEDEAYEEWQDRTGKDVQAFRATAGALLTRPFDARKSDVCGAITRADLMLDESDFVWPTPPHRWLLAVTDGQDNAHQCKPVSKLASGARVVAVNGDGRVATIDAISPQIFESTKSAVAFIVSTETRKR
jgi:hypothetical protein